MRGSPSHFSDEPGIPLSTWVIGGAALLVLVAAGTVFLQGKPSSSELPVRAAPEAPPEAESIAVPVPAAHPLDLSARLLDARQRAEIWSKDAMLARIEAEVRDGKEVAQLTVEFARPQSRALPGATLDPQSFEIHYGVEKTTSVEKTGKPRPALADPNCPLEAALRALKNSGTLTQGHILATYMHSPKHDRPVWQIVMTQDASRSVDAATCAILTR